MDSKSCPPLRKVKPFYFGSLKDTSLASSTQPRKFRRLLRIDFKDPKEDYTFVQNLRCDQGKLVSHQKNRLHLAVIRESFSPTPLQMIDVLARVQHPNVADIFDLYFHESQLYVVSEYLDVSLLDLEFKIMAPEEWEIATIIAEVIKAMTYLLDTIPVCELHIDSVRISLQGDVKLVPDMHYQKSPENVIADHQYNTAFITGILEVLMSHGTSNLTGWSQEALEFSCIPTSDSLAPFINHVFLSKAVSTSRLIPRVRLATQMLSCQPEARLEEHS